MEKAIKKQYLTTYYATLACANCIARRGIGTIDIELTNIDINQCDADEADDEDISSLIDVFRGTHNCPSSTKVNRKSYA